MSSSWSNRKILIGSMLDESVEVSIPYMVAKTEYKTGVKPELEHPRQFPLFGLLGIRNKTGQNSCSCCFSSSSFYPHVLYDKVKL